ncbi:MAG: MarR family transcriptional regulator [Pseudomonadota bacterium]
MDDIDKLHFAVITLLRALKIAETTLRTEHRELNLQAADIQTLRFVAGNPECMLSDLANHLGVVPTTASSIADRLEDRGLLARQRPKTNRRAVALTLTDDGRNASAAIEREELATMQVMLEALPKSERKRFVAAMTTIAETVLKRQDL